MLMAASGGLAETNQILLTCRLRCLWLRNGEFQDVPCCEPIYISIHYNDIIASTPTHYWRSMDVEPVPKGGEMLYNVW